MIQLPVRSAVTLGCTRVEVVCTSVRASVNGTLVEMSKKKKRLGKKGLLLLDSVRDYNTTETFYPTPVRPGKPSLRNGGQNYFCPPAEQKNRKNQKAAKRLLEKPPSVAPVL